MKIHLFLSSLNRKIIHLNPWWFGICLILLLVNPFSSVVLAQGIQWDKTLGGTKYDQLSAMIGTADGGYLLAGKSYSGIGGHKSEANKGWQDYWVVKTDGSGNKAWDKTFGGSAGDYLQDIVATADGGYLLGGYSLSGAGKDKTQGGRGGYDYWIVKTDRHGVKVWDKTFGGTSDDQLNALLATADGGFLLGGYSNSGSSGDKSAAGKGGFDYWILKISGSGKKEWDKAFGGTGNDLLQAMISTTDGGYLLGGTSRSSIGGDKSQASRGEDYWVVKIDNMGSKKWDKTFSGDRDDALISLVGTKDGGFLLGGYSNSTSGYDKSQANRGTLSTDYWILKLNGSGERQWDKTFGGSQYDFLSSLLVTPDGSYLLGGYSYSGKGGDKSEASKGKCDYWIIKINSIGNKVWDKTLGGNGYDYNTTVMATTNSSYLLGGFSFSGIKYDKSEANKGGADYWLVKLSAGSGITAVYDQEANVMEEQDLHIQTDTETGTEAANLIAYPNPFSDLVTINFKLPQTQEIELKVYNKQGLEVESLYKGKAHGNRLYELKWHPVRQRSGELFIIRLQGKYQSDQIKIIYYKEHRN